MRGRGQVVIAAVVAVVLLALFFFFFIRPRQNELSALDEQIVAEEARTQSLQVELQRLQDLQARAPELEAELAEIRELVPERNQVPNFIFQVQQAANRSGVGFLQITPALPQPPPEGALVAEITVTLRARGGYFAIQDFMRRLYDLDRALRIDVVGMAGTESEEEAAERGRVELNMTARIFFELPEDVPPTEGTTAPAPSPEPAEESPAATPTETVTVTPTPTPTP